MKNLILAVVIIVGSSSQLFATNSNLLLLTKPVTEHVDLIEQNHFHDENGKPVYDQVIFYEWCASSGKYFVRHWRLLDHKKFPQCWPLQNHMSGSYYCRWFDDDTKFFFERKITSKLFRETWTQVDPERVNKKLLDERLRTSLINIEKLLKPEPQVASVVVD